MAVNFLYFNFPEIPDVRCAFQFYLKPNKNDGELAVPGVEELAFAKQVHGVNVREASSLEPDEADGLMTDRPGLGLVIRAADCQPIMIAHKSGQYVMAIHAGWRGLRANFPRIAVERFCQAYSLKPIDLAAVRGPSLGFARFSNFMEEWGLEWLPWYDASSQYVNLWNISRWQLRERGVPDASIYEIDISPLDNPDYFYSWRKDKTSVRQANIVWIKTPGRDY